MVSCVFPGSFNPVTKGHADLIARASSIFDRVTVVVMNNIHKPDQISADRRVDMIRRVCATFPNVKVEKWDGLMVDYLREKKERIVIRGIRGAAELEQEMHACEANRNLYEKTETVFLPCNPMLSGISSSAVREIVSFGGDIRNFVPDGLTEEIYGLLSKER